MRLLFVALAAAGLLTACGQSASEIAAEGGEPAGAGSPAAQKNLAEGKAFLENNAKVEGIKTLPTGVQYKVVKSGPVGGISPKPEDEIKIHYEGKLLDGTVFDSSYERGLPTSFVLGNLVPGWIDALQQMKPGDEWILYIPADRAYGSEDRGPIPGNSVLIFKIELFDVLARA